MLVEQRLLMGCLLAYHSSTGETTRREQLAQTLDSVLALKTARAAIGYGGHSVLHSWKIPKESAPAVL
jgi:hypothetical protein